MSIDWKLHVKNWVTAYWIKFAEDNTISTLEMVDYYMKTFCIHKNEYHRVYDEMVKVLTDLDLPDSF